MRGQPWTQAEVDLLSDLAGCCAPRRLGEVYRQQAERLGYPLRSDYAVATRAAVAGISTRPVDGDWTCRSLAQALGIHDCHVHKWVKLHPEIFNSDRNRHHVITRSQMRAFVRAYPDRVARVDRLALTAVLGEKASKELLPKVPSPRSPRKFYCVETDTVCRNSRELCQMLFPKLQVTRSLMNSVLACVAAATRNGGTAYGYHWRQLD